MKTITDFPPQTIQRLLSRCHERQFNGEDWQAAATDAWNELGNPESQEDEIFKFFCSSPEPSCDCGFCGTAAFE